MISIHDNRPSLAARQVLGQAQASVSKSVQRLSSGMRVNSASDNVADNGSLQRLRSQQANLKQAIKNSEDGISLIQTADTGLESINGILTRIRELAVQGSTAGNLTNNERQNIDQEFQLLELQIGTIVSGTSFNDNQLIDGSLSGGVNFQVGRGTGPNALIPLTVVDSDATALGLNDESLSSATGAQAAIDALDTAIQSIATTRGTLGATQNRLSVTISLSETQNDNLSAAMSRIQDTDVAAETANMTHQQILQQAATSILAQANQMPQTALSLINNA